MNDNQTTNIAEKLWELAYRSFEGSGSVVGTVMASRNQANEVQFRLMKNLALLKKEPGDNPDRKILGRIVADVLVSESMGWVTKETSQKMQDLIDEMLGEEA